MDEQDLNTFEVQLLFAESHEIFQRLAVEYPSNTHYQRDLAVSYWRLGDSNQEENKIDLAKQNYQAALDQLLAMQESGILDQDDEQYIPMLEQELAELVE